MELDFSDVTQDYDLILKYINDTSRPIDLGMLLNVFTLSLSSSSQFRSSLCLIRELRVKRIPKVSDGLHWRELCAALIDNLAWSPKTVVLSRELLTDLLANTIISEDIFLSACVHPHPRVACEVDWCVSKLFKRHKINIREGFEKVKKDCEVYIKQDCKEDRGTPKSEEKKATIKEILHFPKDVNLWLKTIDEASKTEIGRGDNQNCEITEILEDLRSDNANTKNRGLKSLKCLSKDLRKHCSIADDLLEVLHPLIKNPYYRKESCLALAHLIEVNCLKSVADSTLHLLFQAVCSSTSKRSACPPFLTLTVIVRHMKPIRMIPFVQFHLKRAKSGTPTKKRMLCLLEQILNEWPRKNLIKMSATLFELLRAGFNGDPNESFHFKKIYWCFEAKFHLQAVALFMKLDVRCQAKPFDTPEIASSVCVTPTPIAEKAVQEAKNGEVDLLGLDDPLPVVENSCQKDIFGEFLSNAQQQPQTQPAQQTVGTADPSFPIAGTSLVDLLGLFDPLHVGENSCQKDIFGEFLSNAQQQPQTQPAQQTVGTADPSPLAGTSQPQNSINPNDVNLFDGTSSATSIPSENKKLSKDAILALYGPPQAPGPAMYGGSTSWFELPNIKSMKLLFVCFRRQESRARDTRHLNSTSSRHVQTKLSGM